MKGSTSHMPSRNIVKEFAADSYYHVYNRGVEKRLIFKDEKDYSAFLGLVKKYLTGEHNSLNNRHRFNKLDEKLDLIAYCLMPNHFHLLIYQKKQDGITDFMRRVMTGYAMYFNHRYNRVGGLFQGSYKAAQINADDYLHHITRYIHLNPDQYKTWPYSSYQNYVSSKNTKWLNTGPVLELFDNSKSKYEEFVDDYQANKQELSVLKWQLANNLDD